ncbi:MAG: aldehyde dehydrogenase family protein, partial [Myxococcaceae bacterium]
MGIEQRKKQLRGILAFMKECESDILKALKEDLNKPVFEAHATELGLIRSEIAYILKNLRSWMEPRRVVTPIVHQPGTSWVQ